jgi:hypothetical protein
MGHRQADPGGHLVDEAGDEKADSHDTTSVDGSEWLTTLVSHFAVFAKCRSQKWRKIAAITRCPVAAQGCFVAF